MSDDGKIISRMKWKTRLLLVVLFPLNGNIFLQMEKSIMENHFVALLYNMVLCRVFEFIRLLLFYDLKVTEFYIHSE